MHIYNIIIYYNIYAYIHIQAEAADEAGANTVYVSDKVIACAVCVCVCVCVCVAELHELVLPL